MLGHGILEGKNVIITGTNRGIGRCIVETFAAQGANIWAHARICTPEFEEFCEGIKTG
jgi:3-oxoacyl-[acyl-carrier protein] reductase